MNSRLLSESGGPCQCSEATRDDFACRFYDDEYNQCVEDFRRELITVTAVSSFVGCLLMGFGANLPFALAPGISRAPPPRGNDALQGSGVAPVEVKKNLNASPSKTPKMVLAMLLWDNGSWAVEPLTRTKLPSPKDHWWAKESESKCRPAD